MLTYPAGALREGVRCERGMMKVSRDSLIDVVWDHTLRRRGSREAMVPYYALRRVVRISLSSFELTGWWSYKKPLLDHWVCRDDSGEDGCDSESDDSDHVVVDFVLRKLKGRKEVRRGKKRKRGWIK